MQAFSADCSRLFTAVHNSGHRKKDDILWLVLHDEEADTARSAATWFENPASGGSAHLCVDDEICFRTLPNDVIPWAASSAPQLSANTHGFHIEQAGYARWSSAVWMSHWRTLRRAAFKTAQHAVLFGIPTVFLGANALVVGARAGKLPKGVTTHKEISVASRILDPGNASRYTHSDPGLLWPRRVFMGYVRTYAKQIGPL